MINADRIVPVQATDLITLYSVILNVGGEAVAKVDANGASGDFEIETASSKLIASEPLTSCDFDSDLSTATLYFVPSYDYKGFSIGGTAVTPTGTVEADGATLYKAALATNAVTITKVGL